MSAAFAEQFLRSGAWASLGDHSLAIGWGEQRWSSTPDASAPFCFYFPDFFLSHEKPWLTFENLTLTDCQTVQEWLPKAFGVHPVQWHPANRPLFEWQCETAREKLNQGFLRKAVPYAMETARSLTENQFQVSLLACLKHALKQPVALYGFWNQHEKMWGVTPELLFRQKNEKIETMALAGTVQIDPKQKRQSAQKLSDEHSIVVQGLLETLKPFGAVQVFEKETIPYSHLSHFKTALELLADEKISFEKLVRALHPTAAVGTYPRDEVGWAWLRQVQQYLQRGRYGAPVGIKWANGDGLCWVGIRNVQWYQGQASLTAGCGFVVESNTQEEWDELQLKLSAVKQILAL